MWTHLDGSARRTVTVTPTSPTHHHVGLGLGLASCAQLQGQRHDDKQHGTMTNNTKTTTTDDNDATMGRQRRRRQRHNNPSTMEYRVAGADMAHSTGIIPFKLSAQRFCPYPPIRGADGSKSCSIGRLTDPCPFFLTPTSIPLYPAMAPATSETVDGPRKRKHTTGDPNNSEIARMERQAELQRQRAAKKQKGAPVPPASTSATTAATLASSSQRQPSVEMEEVEDKDVYAPRAGPRNSSRILELADGSDDDDKELPAVINVASSATPSDADITTVDDSDDNEESRAGDWEDEDAPETAEEELARLSQDWTAPIYVFFKEKVKIEIVRGRRCHVFQCAATNCLGANGRGVRRFLDKKDAKLTGNLHKHAIWCWGEKTVKAANSTANAASAREALASAKSLDVSITALFKRAAKATVTYSHCQHTTAEARAEFVRWVCESKRPFQIVNDRAFRSLMKTGRPGYTIPSAETLSRDVKKVFTNVRQRIAKMMQEYEGQLNFATDAWTSPNNCAFVAFTVHFEHEGEPISMLLDIVELAKSHSGKNLADTFKKVLADFGVEDKPEDDSEDDEDGLGNERAGMSAAEIAELEESLGPVRALLTKLRAFSNAVKRSSTLLLPAWLAMLKKLALRVRNMPRDVLTRWNSTFEMLEFAITYRGAIDAMTSERSLNLRNTPSLSKVIPAMDHIDATLATTMDDMTVPPSIRAAVAIGKRTLNKYYNKTDHTEVYRIAMVLDPQHKLEYFTKAGWEQEWINAACNIVRDEYDRTYALCEVDDPVEISKFSL
ncbi:hypothetical protein D9619_003301 [Psilocybe cf. subviscida]|uniref:hAT-like transposase RNase-H fold domain-containing protein n=1 Tax=Psilocybe cf. subviscida TaxID=2480587 RepID=A0A8H5EUB9_9AGAR|nr:hypothetical protein D9619_003301 [Psilocybe cf. subviscida]